LIFSTSKNERKKLPNCAKSKVALFETIKYSLHLMDEFLSISDEMINPLEKFDKNPKWSDS